MYYMHCKSQKTNWSRNYQNRRKLVCIASISSYLQFICFALTAFCSICTAKISQLTGSPKRLNCNSNSDSDPQLTLLPSTNINSDGFLISASNSTRRKREKQNHLLSNIQKVWHAIPRWNWYNLLEHVLSLSLYLFCLLCCEYRW